MSQRDHGGTPRPEDLRELFHRKALAGEVHRAAAARALGVSDSEMAAIAHLARHGHLTPAALSGLLDITSGGMTALLHRLEQAGHVERRRHPGDGRSVLVSLTAETVARAGELYAPLVAELDAIATRYSPDERTLVGRYLADVAKCAEEQATGLREAARTSGGAADVGAPTPSLWA